MKWDESQHPRDSIGQFTRKDKAEIIKLILENRPLSRQKREDTVQVYLPDFRLPCSVGAKWANYRVLDLKTMKYYNFVEGTWVTHIKPFSGKGTKSEYRDAWKFAERYGGEPEEWQHVKGIGVLDTEYGPQKAEIHWSQHREYDMKELFVKKWLAYV